MDHIGFSNPAALDLILARISYEPQRRRDTEIIKPLLHQHETMRNLFGSSLSCMGGFCEHSVRSVTLWGQSVTGLRPLRHRVRTERLTKNPKAIVSCGYPLKYIQAALENAEYEIIDPTLKKAITIIFG